MTVGPLSSNWFLYKTLMDTALFNQSSRLGAFGLSNSAFQILLEQALLKAQGNQMEPGNAGIATRLPENPSFGPPTLENAPASGLSGAQQNLASTGVEASALNSRLGGILENTGEFFVEAGRKYEISPALLAAISIHETGNGTSNAARFKFNVAGMMGKDGLKTYPSVKESIFDMARNLRQNYLDKGKMTIAQIGAKYAPIGAANDPTNLNNHWVKGVNKQFAALTSETDFA
ncbi:conjugal transfer protein [Neobacillus piezotolerans]|uniref:Conjugal transfer protein n=1 Tax=Neobacillus piezotolerans TaxID=2259171 RepID=A0A3D8GPA3_9BACI|nr:glucosaminidase domain-containing protein [Neobacillus piezotolerans]RDU35906.1 conjugal transfer protein [Neobacillus piezotolerans]